ncbi:MAG: ATP-dependent RecD-like DNA helicase [Parachlamydiaceae bacterium]
MEQVSGYIERITFQNEENGYAVLQLKCKGLKDLVTAVGHFPAIAPGETIFCLGHWIIHPSHGRQFEVKSNRIEAPSDIIGIKKYLGSGLIKGIGPVYAAKIVDAFGLETLDVIDRNPERLLSIKGLGKKRAELILNCWADQRTIRDVMVFLQGHGVSPAYAQKIFKIYREKSVEVVKENPYKLAREVFGIGFKIADAIAEKLGIDKQSPLRIDAGIEFVLNSLSDDGHVCYPLDKFLPIAREILELPAELLPDRIDSLENEERIFKHTLLLEGEMRPCIWLRNHFFSEVGIAKELERIRTSHGMLRAIDVERALTWVQDKLKIQLAVNQSKAVAESFTGKIHIITGGPGTGKSTITKAILTIAEQLTDKILLAAPTGRAAKRMAEITGKKSSTIHALLEVDFKAGGFKRKRDNPLECDLLIVDEASMIDTPLMYSLLKAVPSHSRILFVGDIHQLPSVGPGNVLQDMIASLQIPVTTLNEIFRQAQGSRIITNSHKINQGSFPDLSSTPESDFYFVEAQEPEDVLKQLVALTAERVPRKYGFNPIFDIQVLAPMKRGVVGTENLNQVLQEILNPQKDSLFKAGRKFKQNDKVMQIRNNYQKEVFNGDVGKILSIDMEEQEIIVLFDDREVVYDFSDLDELVLAYAISVHKFQGSECPCILMPVHTTHFKLLHRNLLYTGVTRGKKLVILVGTKKALMLAIKNDEVKQRYTGLKQAILGHVKTTV